MELKKTFALVGLHLNHSFSPLFFKTKFEKLGLKKYDYQLIELNDLTLLNHIIIQKNICGFNVTIPYKESIVTFCHHLTPEAFEVKAVNCVKIINQKWVGHNTDAAGFYESILPFAGKYLKKALIFGDGGASKAVKYAFNLLNIPFLTINRSKNSFGLSYEQLNKEHFENSGFIVNTTPCGMFPNINESLNIPYEYINQNHLCIDLIYNPQKTIFLERSQDQGATIMNGHAMLINQANLSWDFWNNELNFASKILD